MAAKITFAITYWQKDAALAQKSAAALKQIYPTAQVLVIEDNPHLKLAQFGGQWTERWMKAALATEADVIIKLDPDTRATNAVTTFPTTDVFGQEAPVNTYWPKSSNILCGGAIGFQAAAVQKIVASGFLLDSKYTQKPYVTEERRFGTPRETISLQDPIVADVVQRLSLTTGNWPGLSIKFAWEPAVAPPKDAIFVHPVKE